MRKVQLGLGVGELPDGDSPAMSVAVATERAAGTELVLSGLVSTAATATEQVETIFETIDDVLVNDLGGRREDVTRLRFLVREETLTESFRRETHALRRSFFTAPEYPAATMVGVADLVHEDALVEIEADAFVPNDAWEVETVFPDD